MENRIQQWLKKLHRQRLEPGQIAELEAHLRDTIDELLIKGFSEEEAFTQAEQRVGNLKSIARQEWNVNGKKERKSMMPAFVPMYFTQAWRQLRRNRVHSMITLSGLILGMTGCLLLAIYVQFERSFDTFHDDYEQIYRVYDQNTRNGETTDELMMPNNLTKHLENEIAAIVAGTSIRVNSGVEFSTDDNRRIRMKVLAADSSFNDVFSFKTINGEALPDFGRQEILITPSAALRLFGTEQVTGKTLIWHDYPDREVTVRALVAEAPGNSHFGFDIIVTRPMHAGTVRWGSSGGDKAYVKLAKGTEPDELVRQMHAFQTAAGNDTSMHKLSLMPLANIHLDSKNRYEIQVNGDRETIVLFATISILILIIACGNYAIITTSRYVRRIREMGMRKVLGASHRDIFGQFFSECLLQLCIVIPVSLLLTWLLLPEIGSLMNRQFPAFFPNYLSLSLLTSSIVGISMLLSGTLPAMLLYANQTMTSLRGQIFNTRVTSTIQKGAVTLQFGITAFLLIYMSGIHLQMNYVRSLDLGYNPENLLHFRISDRDGSKLMKQRLEMEPGVISTSVSAWLPGKTSMSGSFDNPKGEGRIRFEALSGDHDFLQTLGIALIDGRNFDPAGSADTLDLDRGVIDSQYFRNMSQYPILLNKKALEILEIPEPILGTELQKDIHGRVIGIIDDVKFFSLHEAMMPMRISFETKSWAVLVRYEPSYLPEVLTTIQKMHRELTDGTSPEIIFVDEYIESLYAAESRDATLITASVILAITLSLMGLLGMIMFALEHKTREIGIRKVLGAEIPQLIWLLTRPYLLLIALGSMIGVPFAHWFLHEWLNNFAYRVDSVTWIYLAAAGVTLLMAWLVISWQAGRAALENPVKALRSE